MAESNKSASANSTLGGGKLKRKDYDKELTRLHVELWAGSC